MNDSVSAVCVTHPTRFGSLQRALLNFAEQTYRPLELLVLTADEEHLERIRDFSTSLPPETQGRLRLFRLPFANPSEAALQAFALAEGAWIAAWDDDDQSDPQRLERQIAGATKQRPCVLGAASYLFRESGELFVVDSFDQPAGRFSERCAYSSVVFHRRGYRPFSPRHDYVSWARLLMSGTLLDYDLLRDDEQHRALDFIVGCNGDNLSGVAYHRRQVERLPRVRTREQLLEQAAALEPLLNRHRFDGGTITVCGRDAQAFEVSTPAWPPTLESTQPSDDVLRRLPTFAMLQEQQRLRVEQAKAARKPAQPQRVAATKAAAKQQLQEATKPRLTSHDLPLSHPAHPTNRAQRAEAIRDAAARR